MKSMILKTLIKRFFYPIGQGGFYAEKHQIGNEKFTIVYDCGTCLNCKKGQLKFSDIVIEKAFKRGEIIDILFISHFDYEHVNKIAKLKEHTKIKKVIMPLLNKSEKYLLSNIYRVLNFKNIIPLLENPEKFFGKSTTIIQVEPTENNKIGKIEPFIIKEINNNTILKSGQPLQISSNSDWIFIPYNYEYKNRYKKLVKKFEDVGFSEKEVNSLQDGTRLTLKKMKDRNRFQKIYDSLSSHGRNSKINENSMLLYSGPITNGRFKKKSYSYDLEKDMIHGILIKNNRVACIYTGDTNLTVVDIRIVFISYWNMVGTIQIPHHGDEKSFNNNILDKKGYCCPISIGSNPSDYPSKSVIKEIISQDSYPILVSEYLNSGFIEYIDNEYYMRLKENDCLAHLVYIS